jgi:hypothetical protein
LIGLEFTQSNSRGRIRRDWLLGRIVPAQPV